MVPVPAIAPALLKNGSPVSAQRQVPSTVSVTPVAKAEWSSS
jgi:hypothetical protein